MRDELEAYGAGLSDKPEVIALNKVDTIDEELTAALVAELEEASGETVLPVSGATGQGVEEVLDALVMRIGRFAGPKEDADEGDWSPL